MSYDDDVNHREEARKVITTIENDWTRRSLISKEYFRWPSTKAHGGDGSLDGSHWEKEGVLRFLGYGVGVSTDIGSLDRQRILSRAFEGTIPPFSSRDYISKWGDPATSARLEKIAKTLASLTRDAKRRRDADMSQAVSDWESDLQFLYEQFYVLKFGFGWPSTNL